jgi:hypothetical protein
MMYTKSPEFDHRSLFRGGQYLRKSFENAKARNFLCNELVFCSVF